MPRNKCSEFPTFFIFLIIVFISFSFTLSLKEVKTLPGKKFNTQEDISRYLQTTDVTVLVFYYKTESEKADEIAQHLKVVYLN